MTKFNGRPGNLNTSIFFMAASLKSTVPEFCKVEKTLVAKNHVTVKPEFSAESISKVKQLAIQLRLWKTFQNSNYSDKVFYDNLIIS